MRVESFNDALAYGRMSEVSNGNASSPTKQNGRTNGVPGSGLGSGSPNSPASN